MPTEPDRYHAAIDSLQESGAAGRGRPSFCRPQEPHDHGARSRFGAAGSRTFFESGPSGPDMAHQLWPVQRSAHGAGETLTLLRTDIERTPMDVAGSASLVDPQDWATLLTARDHLIYKFVKRWYELDQRVGHRFPNHRLWYFVRDRLVSRMLRLFGDAERIMTNRLHGVILGCLVERPVSYFDNSYGKLSRYCSTWLEGCLVNRI